MKDAFYENFPLLVVGFIFAGSMCFVCLYNAHVERMADKGYCQTTIIGVGDAVWSKCEVNK